VALVLCEGVGVDQKVVEVDNEEFVQEFAEGVIHIVLEQCSQSAI